MSDTHGTLDPAAPRLFEDVDLIVHAGDIGGADILLELEALAPVVAVRGNTDHGAWALELPDSASIRAGTLLVWIVHDASGQVPPPGAAVVVCGHTHRPSLERAGNVLHVNPGSATEPRGGIRRPTVARLELHGGRAPVAAIHRL
ncbi:MAG: metallophosphoesterase family protein [Anaerosomatales bacterium]